MRRRNALRWATWTVACALLVSGCGDDSEQPSANELVDTAAQGGTTEKACDAVKLGPITRCENFYEDYWPTIDENLDKLYEKAKTTDGGKLVVWDWYELSPDVQKAFNARFPGLKISTKGLTYNLSSAIISADASGSRNTDVVSGSITSMTAMYDEGFWEKVDWTKYGVPKEFLGIGSPELLPDSLNGALIHLNTDKAPSEPTSLDDFLAPEWKGKLAMASFEAQDFTGYGMANGKDKMVQLIKDLKGNDLTLTDDPGSLLSSGDKAANLATQLYNPNPALKPLPFESANTYVQFSGINKAGKNKYAAMLFELWNAYDPDWLEQRLTDEKFASSALPYPGLPAATFDQSKGLIKQNQDAWFAAIDKDWAIFETQENRDEFNDLIAAANDTLNK
jgi:putative spermidine/putrescine transport system substrate-binding protein